MEGDNVLKSLLASQKKTLKFLERFSKRINKLEETVSGLAKKSTDASAETSPDQQKRLPPKLSVSIKATVLIFSNILCSQKTVALVHESLGEEDQFRPHLGYVIPIHCIHFYRSKDKHNVKVKERIAEEISMGKDNEYSKFLVECK